MARRIGKNTAGFTLIEMMVAIAMGMIVIASVTGTFTAQTRQNATEEQVSQLHQNVRGAIEMITRDLMQAGYKAPSCIPPNGATVCVTGVTYSATQLLIQADLNGTIGTTTAIDTSSTSEEYIIYTYDAANKQIKRQLGTGGTAEIVADNITAATFAFKDASGNSTATSADIRKVTVSITGQTAKADPSYTSNSGHRTYQLSADIAPPNLPLPLS